MHVKNCFNFRRRSDKFVSMALRTRQELLKDLATNYVTQTTLDSGSKFSEPCRFSLNLSLLILSQLKELPT